eukprot:g26735.t1
MHRDITQNRVAAAVTFSLQQHAGFAVVVHIACGRSRNANHAGDDNLLANLADHFFVDLLQRGVGSRCVLFEQFFGGRGARPFEQLGGQFVGEPDKIFAAGDRCRFTLNFDHYGFAAVVVRFDNDPTFSGRVFAALIENFAGFGFEDFDGFFFVAAGFHKRLLAFHHGHGFQLFETLQSAANRSVVRQRATEPAFGDIGHAAGFGGFLHGVGGLAFGAAEQNQASLSGDFAEADRNFELEAVILFASPRARAGSKPGSSTRPGRRNEPPRFFEELSTLPSNAETILALLADRGASVASDIVDDVLSECRGIDRKLVEAHFTRVRNPERYLRDFVPKEISSHLKLISRLTDQENVTAQVRRNDDGFEVVVAGTDMRGVSACITGCLAEMGLSITQMAAVTYESCSETRPPETIPDDEPATRPSVDRYVLTFSVIPSDFIGNAESLSSRLRSRLKAAYWHLQRGDVQRAFQESDDPDELTGQVIDGRFRVERFLDQGGMGTIYLATQLDLDRPVAMKLLRSEFGDEKEFVEGLQREGRLLAQLRSPYVVDVYAAGIYQERCWIAMEYRAGGDVAHWIEHHGVPPHRLAARWLKESLMGLSYIHRNADLVHGDVKPNNLLLDTGFRLKIGDLGLGQLRRLIRMVEPDGKIRGTPWYMSPEQACGDRLDERSDLNSLGNTFFHILTGTQPFAGSSPMEILARVTRGEHPRLHEVAPNVPAGLAVIIERLMQPDRLRRYQNADVALADLQSYFHLNRITENSAPPDIEPEPVQETVKWPGRVLRRLPQLKMMTACGIGTDSFDLGAASEMGIAVCNVPGWTAPIVAEHALALMFAISRRTSWMTAEMKQGRWPRKLAVSLQGKTMGIVGTGNIGCEMARLSRAVGMDVLAWSFHPDDEKQKRLGFRYAGFDEVLRESDVISLHVKLTEQSRNLIGEREIQNMKPGALLVNTARGAVVDTAALIAALDSGHLAGAALDVFENEPLDADDPILRCEQVVLTPHAADQTPEGIDRLNEGCVDNVLAFLSGRSKNVVNA